MKVLLLDNQDSFVYNLLTEFEQLGYETLVMRNTVPAKRVLETIAQENISLVCLSPGPGHPNDAGCMPEVLAALWGSVPLLGICLGFQAILEYKGGAVERVGAVHGQSKRLTITPAGRKDPVFADFAEGVNVARYHSLGCVNPPAGLVSLARIGQVCMAARAEDAPVLGLQFHPESILTDHGPQLLVSAVESLVGGNNNGK